MTNLKTLLKLNHRSIMFDHRISDFWWPEFTPIEEEGKKKKTDNPKFQTLKLRVGINCTTQL